MYLLVDVRGYRRGTQPGVIFGANAITVYVLADVLALLFYRLPAGERPLNERAVDGLISLSLLHELASLLYALFFVGINFIPAYLLYRRRIFIRL